MSRLCWLKLPFCFIFTLCNRVGSFCIDFLINLYIFFTFSSKMLFNLVFNTLKRPLYLNRYLEAFFNVGFNGLGLVSLTALCSGMVLALQSSNGFARFGATFATASVVGLSLCRELSPVLVGLMITARSGSFLAAKLASMQINEQVDVLKVLNINIYKYLLVPYFLSFIICVPLMVLVANIIGITGGLLICQYVLGFNRYEYINQILNVVGRSDIMLGVIKAVFFGGTIGLISTFLGYYKSSKEVGYATIQTVVRSSIGILILNYLITYYWE